MTGLSSKSRLRIDISQTSKYYFIVYYPFYSFGHRVIELKGQVRASRGETVYDKSRMQNADTRKSSSKSKERK